MTQELDVWAKLAAPLPLSVVQWRQQGKGKPRDGKHFAPFVAYIDAQFVRERLDSIVPGVWNLTLELMPHALVDGNGETTDEPYAFKARLEVLGSVREDVGSGRDYKTASTDAFKRAAVRFGIGHELYTDYEILWVQVDGEGKYAKALEDPADVYARRQQRGSVPARQASAAPSPSATSTERPAHSTGSLGDDAFCPKCGGTMWDNRLSKRNPKQPDFKCRNRSCDGVIWPPKNGTAPAMRSAGPVVADEDYPYDENGEIAF